MSALSSSVLPSRLLAVAFIYRLSLTPNSDSGDHSHDSKYHEETWIHCFGDLSSGVLPFLLFFMSSNALCDELNGWIAVETSFILFLIFKASIPFWSQ